MSHTSEHLLAFVLVVGFPLWDLFHTRYVRAHGSASVRLGLYATVVICLSLVAAWSVLTTHRSFLVLDATGVTRLPVPSSAVMGIAGGMAGGLVLSLLAAYLRPHVAHTFAKALQPMAFMLPQSLGERLWFVAVSVAAGVCEEILYRGYLLHYGVQVLAMPAKLAIGLAVISFGFAHTYQGWKGVLLTSLLGAVFMAMYLAAGILWPSMLLHTLVDLRIALLPRRAIPAWGQA
jgi:uncharacterized protein